MVAVAYRRQRGRGTMDWTLVVTEFFNRKVKIIVLTLLTYAALC